MALDVVDISRCLSQEVSQFSFSSPVAYVYNPLVYAWAAHQCYLKRYGQAPKEVVLLGMNPGPWGMAQTGVPFGEITSVRQWMGIESPVGKPAREHPKRPVQGFACPRSEVSGARLWGWAQRTWGLAENFFKRFMVANYCPLCFIEADGKNRTPDKLPKHERDGLLAACDLALRQLVQVWKPRYVVGIGKFAQARASQALKGMDIRIGHVLHPSPANPLAHRHWGAQAQRALEDLGIHVP